MFANFYQLLQTAVSLPDFSTTRDIGGFISQIYNFAIAIVGVAIFVRFIMAGWLYLTAAGNSGNVKKAHDMMTNAIIGAILLFSSYLILYVINPDLVKQSFEFKILQENQPGQR